MLQKWIWDVAYVAMTIYACCKREGQVGGFGSMDRVAVKLKQDLAPMDEGNGEKQVKSRSMSQYDHVMIQSGSYHLVIGWCMCLKALVWFYLIDETLSANLVYQSDYEIGSTTPSDEAMAKIMTMVMAW